MRVPSRFRPFRFHATIKGVATIAATICLIVPAAANATTYNFAASLDGAQETPPNGSTGTGTGTFVLDTATHQLSFDITYSGLGSNENAAHIHGFSGPGVMSGILFPLPAGVTTSGHKVGAWTGLTTVQENNIYAGLTYANIHTATFGLGEIRGQILLVTPIPTASEWGLVVFALLLLSSGALFALRRRSVVSA